MTRKSSLAFLATLMLAMVMIHTNLEFIAADPNIDEPNFHFPCAVKCLAQCVFLPTLPQKVACAASCIWSCWHNPSPPSDKVTHCTLDCANSSALKFYSDGGYKLDLNRKEDVEKIAGFVDVCYDKCKKLSRES